MEVIRNIFVSLIDHFAAMTLPEKLTGILAMIFCISAFLLKNRKAILVVQLIGMGLWTVHFFLLHQYAGAAMNGIAAIRGLVYVQRGRFKWTESKIIPEVFIVLFIGAGLFTFFYGGDNNFWLPVIAMTITSIGLFFKDEQRVRLISLFSSPPWIVYNALAGSIPAVITESLVMLATFLGLVIYRKKKNS